MKDGKQLAGSDSIQSERPTILRRFALLSVLGSLGAIAFIPSVRMSAVQPPSTGQLSLFALIASAVCVASSWFGLLFADAVHLPMPHLRWLDRQFEPVRRNGVLPATAFGILFAVAAICILRAFHQQNLAGPLWSRIASVLFAAGSLEIVIHLFFMSLVVRLARGKIWTGILAAAFVFLTFHLVGITGQSVGLIVATALLNGTFGVVLGAVYARYGFEYVLLCHAVAHVLAVTLA